MAIYANKHGFTFHDSDSASFEETAANVWRRPEPTPGQAFARKCFIPVVAMGARHVPSRIKQDARKEVVRAYQYLPGEIRILTLPGATWAMEKRLLRKRRERGYSTRIFAAEIDPAIYKLALFTIPRGGRYDGDCISVLDKDTVGTNDVPWFERTLIETFIERKTTTFDGAWLDFNGPLTPSNIRSLQTLWPRIRHSLFVTFLGARFSRRVGQAKRKSGSWTHFMGTLLNCPVSKITTLEYNDPVPMIQLGCFKNLPEYKPWMD